MERIFLDTSFLIAYYNADDVNHKNARDLITDMEGKMVHFFISDYILDEILTVLLIRSGKKKAIELCKTILDDIEMGNIELLWIDHLTFEKAIEIFTNFVDKEWSFTDCTSYILIKSNLIEKSASFDEHFRQFGFEVLPSK
jgi:predicted nucleic acid-binding protein